jgi:heat shock protein HslJ
MKNLYRTFLIIILVNAMLVAASAQSLGGEWKLVEARQEGAKISLGSEIRTNLIFGAENRMSGSAGCNRYSTTYKTAGKNQISFEPIISTKMACVNDDFMKQENTFFGVMEKVEKYQTKGKYLIFSDESKQNVLRFERAAKQKS